MRNLAWLVSSAVVALGSLAVMPQEAFACRLWIGDRVWYDANRNGIQDAGETGINGVTVRISPAFTDRNFNLIDSTITGTGPGLFGDGYYLFSGVDCDVEYTISVDLSTLPTGLVPSDIGIGGDTAVDSDNPAGTNVFLPNTGGDYGDETIDFGFYPPAPPPPSVGTGTPGYWKNHPEAWPVDSVVIGNVIYSKAQALVILGLPDGDKKVTMFRALLAAKLNLLNGTDGRCITEDMAAGDQWFITYGPVGSPAIRANSGAWRAGSATAQRLDDYNNGVLLDEFGAVCAPHRE